MNSASLASGSTGHADGRPSKKMRALPQAPAGVPVPPAPANAGRLSLDKSAPYHGTSPYWRVGLFTGNGRFDVNGRFTYTAGRRSFVFDETAVTPAGPAQTTTKVFS